MGLSYRLNRGYVSSYTCDGCSRRSGVLRVSGVALLDLRLSEVFILEPWPKNGVERRKHIEEWSIRLQDGWEVNVRNMRLNLA